ncbi:MAG: hypothetical protein KDA62_18115, partial [Planctomycetales bacterium]|nr:hypothetical protein [Planctomycetales bacterium]
LRKIADEHGLDPDDLESTILRTFPDKDSMFQWEKDVVSFFGQLCGSNSLPSNIYPNGNSF